jgi:hypothetical protein
MTITASIKLENKITGRESQGACRESQGACRQDELIGGRKVTLTLTLTGKPRKTCQDIRSQDINLKNMHPEHEATVIPVQQLELAFVVVIIIDVHKLTHFQLTTSARCLLPYVH